MVCCICRGPAHEATGAMYSPSAVACYNCVMELWGWLRQRMRGRPRRRRGARRGDHGPSFFDHCARSSVVERLLDSQGAGSSTLPAHTT